MKRLILTLWTLGMVIGFAPTVLAWQLGFDSRGAGHVSDDHAVFDPYPDRITLSTFTFRGEVGGDIQEFGESPTYWFVKNAHGGYSDSWSSESACGAFAPPWDKEHPKHFDGGKLHVNGCYGMWVGPNLHSPDPNAVFGIKFDFINGYGGVDFGLNYSSLSTFSIQPYFTNGTHGDPIPADDKNLKTGKMGHLDINIPPGEYIDYVLLWGGDTHTWVVDDIRYDPHHMPDPDPATAPEPSTMLLLAGGLMTIVGYRRFRRI